MSLDLMLNRTATILRRAETGTVDRYNSPTWVNDTGVDVPAYLEQTDAQEIVVGRETQMSDWLIVLPAGTALDGSDRVAVDGVTYEVIGQPARPQRPTTGEHHVEARLRVVT